MDKMNDLYFTKAESLPAAIPARKYPTRIELMPPPKPVRLPALCDHCMKREVENKGDICRTCLSLDLSHWRRHGHPVSAVERDGLNLGWYFGLCVLAAVVGAFLARFR